jgi:hypothetical protein
MRSRKTPPADRPKPAGRKSAIKRFPNITLICVDGRDASLGLRAIGDSTLRAGCRFARHLVFSAREPADVSIPVPENTDVLPIEGLDSIEGYNEFLIKRLDSYIETDFVLVVQWDGFVLNGAHWRPEFFDYDYIGAIWPWHPPGYQVGNGGFSLRSKKLLRALQDPRVIAHHPEDLAICQTYRHFLESDCLLRFAPPEVADRFSFERHPHPGSFGFHGFYNFHRVFSADEIRRRLAELPASVFGSIDATELAHNLSRAGNEAAAREILKKVLRSRHAGEIPSEFWGD